MGFISNVYLVDAQLSCGIVECTRQVISENAVMKSKNVFGEALELCCNDPMTGFYRDGFCRTGPEDGGVHTVCAVMTEDFLQYTKSKGNDLRTPRSEYNFPGLKPGDKWCLCAARWYEAQKAGFAPLVDLASTSDQALKIIPKDILLLYSAKSP